MDTNSIFLSIVIPLYNKERSVSRAISSVLAQSHENFELIVVDDGSTDKSAGRVSAFNDDRLILIRKPNGGVSRARNTGAIAARSSYVCFLDADDEWQPHFLARIAALISDNPNAYLYSCRYEIITEHGERVLGELALDSSHRGRVPRFFWAYRKSRSLIHSSSVCVARSALLDVGGFPEGENVGEDVYVWLTLALQGEVMFDAKISSRIYQDAENRTIVRVSPKIPFFLRSFLNTNLQDQDLKDLILSFVLIYAAISAKRGSRTLALTYSRMSFRHSFPISAYCVIIYMAPTFVIDVARYMRLRKRRSSS